MSSAGTHQGGRGGLLLLLLVGGGLWIWLGDPLKDLAEWFYKENAAPWETVDAFYYPDRSNLTIWRTGKKMPNVQTCRDWVYAMAATYSDPALRRGDYECALGEARNLGGISVYRATVR